MEEGFMEHEGYGSIFTFGVGYILNGDSNIEVKFFDEVRDLGKVHYSPYILR